MKRVDIEDGMVRGLAKSSTDANRLYSILLDARGSATVETMYDIAEKIVQTEKENAKSALERLWALKKNLQGMEDTRTLDVLIQYYQSKIDILRDKEENIGKISRDSRTLLEEKRKRDAEMATVKQEIEDCSREIAQLNDKLSKAAAKEQELQLIEMQLKKELNNNENTIVNGLYEIIIHPHAGIGAQVAEGSDEEQDDTCQLSAQTASSKTAATAEPSSATDAPKAVEENAAPAVSLADAAEEPLEATPEEYRALYQQVERAGADVFPKSVVKTTGGAVIGEYFYDPKVYKNKRNYIFNSLFFGEQLSLRLQTLQKEFNQNMHAEALQMAVDACKRVEENPQLHFEVATNEIVNDKNLKELSKQLKERNYREAGRFCSRLHAKIKALGANYRIMLKEQMARYAES